MNIIIQGCLQGSIGDSFSVVQCEKNIQKQPALIKAIKRPASTKTKSQRKKPKTTEDTSEEDNSFKEDDEDEEVDEADEDADVDAEEEDDGDENADEDKKVYVPDDGVGGEDEEGENTDQEVSEVENDVYETILWDRGGEMFFIRKVARIIASVDNHYPGFMYNIKQMNDALKLAINFTRTAKNRR
jgi:hypothetical protein